MSEADTPNRWTPGDIREGLAAGIEAIKRASERSPTPCPHLVHPAKPGQRTSCIACGQAAIMVDEHRALPVVAWDIFKPSVPRFAVAELSLDAFRYRSFGYSLPPPRRFLVIDDSPRRTYPLHMRADVRRLKRIAQSNRIGSRPRRTDFGARGVPEPRVFAFRSPDGGWVGFA